MKALILVGGEGTRLRPLTYSLPKSMLPILNKPFLEYVIQYLKAHNITEIILAMCYQPHSIKEYFGDGESFRVKINYVIEEIPLGTAGAVKNCAQFLDETFFVLNGDVFTDLNLLSMLSFHRQNKGKLTIALTPVEDPTSFGVVEIDKERRVRSFKEKPSPGAITSNLVNAGIYIMEPDVLEYIPSGFYMFEQGLFPLLLEKGEKVLGFPFTSYWIDIGNPQKYLKLNQDLLLKGCGEINPECQIHPSAYVEGAVVGKGSIIGSGVRINSSVIGPNCRIEEGASIEGSILWQEVKVGKGTILKNSIVATKAFIGDMCWLMDNCVIGENAIIGEGNRLVNSIVGLGKRIEPNTLSF